jgi:hypothetical protein
MLVHISIKILIRIFLVVAASFPKGIFVMMAKGSIPIKYMYFEKNQF